MAPVRRRLVAVWRGEGLSEKAKMEGVEDGICMGPSSGGVAALVVVMGSSGTCASHGSVVVRWLWAETVVACGLQQRKPTEGKMGCGESVNLVE